MAVFSIIKNPWLGNFEGLLGGAEKEVLLASPYIKTDIARRVVGTLKGGVVARCLSNFKLANYYNGSSDLDALRLLLGSGARVRSCHQLHAKVFVFDGKKAVVTSGNLTNGGLLNNFEYGLLVQDAALVGKVREDFLSLFNDGERTNRVTDSIIEKAQAVISCVPAEKRPRMPVGDAALFGRIDNDRFLAEKFTGGGDAIAANLSGWQKTVFLLLNGLPDETFGINRVYEFEEALRARYPRNRHIRDKLRQQLQYLRDYGLLEFLGKGYYKKLWGG